MKGEREHRTDVRAPRAPSIRLHRQAIMRIMRCPPLVANGIPIILGSAGKGCQAHAAASPGKAFLWDNKLLSEKDDP